MTSIVNLEEKLILSLLYYKLYNSNKGICQPQSFLLHFSAPKAPPGNSSPPGISRLLELALPTILRKITKESQRVVVPLNLRPCERGSTYHTPRIRI